MWPWSGINKKLDQLATMVSALGGLITILEESLMAKFEDLETALGLVGKEIGETKAEIDNLKEDIEELKAALPGIGEAELSTKLAGYVEQLTGFAGALDALQTKLPEPPPEEPAA